MNTETGTSNILETARSAAAQAGLDPGKLAQDVGAKLMDVAESQKQAGAETVLGVARAIRSAAGNLEQESPQVAQVVRSAASTIESLTRDLNQRSVEDMGQAIIDMARRSPGLFFAGSMLTGFALFRFLNSAQGGMQSAHHSGSHSSSSSRNYSSSSAQPSMPSTMPTKPAGMGETSGGTKPSSAETIGTSTATGGSSSAGGYGGGTRGSGGGRT